MAKKKENIRTYEYEEGFPPPQEPEIDEVEEVEVEEVEKETETPSSDLDLDWGEVFVFNDYEL